MYIFILTCIGLIPKSLNDIFQFQGIQVNAQRVQIFHDVCNAALTLQISYYKHFSEELELLHTHKYKSRKRKEKKLDKTEINRFETHLVQLLFSPACVLKA